MPRCRADSSIERKSLGTFNFPLGVYPVEELTPKPGYTLDFEPSDGDDDSGDWEAWPDRYVFDAVLSSERVSRLVRSLLAFMPPRCYPILDILGHDAYREIDPYVSYELIGLDRVIDALRQCPDFFFEDGLTGFGAMTEEPFFYFFVDEHKIVTVRAESTMRERVEKLLAAFDLEQTEDAAGVDAAAHEHRSVLFTAAREPRLLGFDEIVERLRDDWRLVLNVDAETNVDDEGKELGTTAWWCRVRVPVPLKDPPKAGSKEPKSKDRPDQPEAAETVEMIDVETRYAEIVLAADNLREAEEAAISAAADLAGLPSKSDVEPFVVFSDRMTTEQLEDFLSKGLKTKKSIKGPLASGHIYKTRWVDD